jgi:hypothetical protein
MQPDWYKSLVKDPSVIDTTQKFDKIFAAVQWTLIPLDIALIFKFYRGVLWFKNEKRSLYQNYYYISFVFYTAFEVQMTLVFLTSMEVLAMEKLFGALMGLAPICLVLLYWQLKITDDAFFTRQKLVDDIKEA